MIAINKFYSYLTKQRKTMSVWERGSRVFIWRLGYI